MKSKPMVFPLDMHGTVYVLEDEDGKSLGTGSRATCYLLLELLTSRSFLLTADSGREATRNISLPALIDHGNFTGR